MSLVEECQVHGIAINFLGEVLWTSQFANLELFVGVGLL